MKRQLTELIKSCGSAEGLDEPVVLSTERMLLGANRGAVNVTLLEGESRGIKAFDIGEMIRREIGVIPEGRRVYHVFAESFW